MGFHIRPWFLTWGKKSTDLTPSGPGSYVALAVALRSGCSHLLLNFPPDPLRSFLPTSLADTEFMIPG